MLVELHHPPGPGPILLGPLTGRAELAVTGTGADAAIALIEAMLQPRPGAAIGPGEAARLTTSDRDRVMARLQAQIYGPDIASTALCGGCGERFDFDFALSALEEQQERVSAAPNDAGWFEQDGVRFRLPTGEDELAAIGLDDAEAAQAIAARCIPDADAGARAVAEAQMAEIAPMLDMTLDAPCPDCGHGNPMRFGVERYFLSTILNERQALWRDIHWLASSYHWSLASILELPRESRQALVSNVIRSLETPKKVGVA